MTVENILYELHNAGTTDLLHLSDVKTTEDKEKYNERGYPVSYTYEEWEKAHPDISPDNIVFMNGVNYSAAYYDKENLTYLHLTPLILSGLEENDSFFESFKKAIEYSKKLLSQKQYYQLLFSYPDGLRIEGLQRLLEIEGETDVFYKTFISVYTTSDFTVEKVPNHIIEAFIKAKSHDQELETEKRIQKHFGNKKDLLVYRGMSKRSSSVSSALSWTPNINLAYKFASSFGDDPVVVTGVVKREDVIEYISPDTTIGNEEEFLVKRGTVHVVNTEQLLTPDSTEIHVCVNAVLPVYQTYRQKLKKLYRKYHKHLLAHDGLHSLRVLLLALIIASHEGLGKTAYKQIAEAAIYHDIGRINEMTDISHGEHSKDIYQKDGGTDQAVMFMIQYHCIDDSVAITALNDMFSIKTIKKVKKMFDILKDADALDRVRFGIAVDPKSDGLDVRYLRNEFAKKLVFFAVKAKQEIEL